MFIVATTIEIASRKRLERDSIIDFGFMSALVEFHPEYHACFNKDRDGLSRTSKVLINIPIKFLATTTSIMYFQNFCNSNLNF